MSVCRERFGSPLGRPAFCTGGAGGPARIALEAEAVEQTGEAPLLQTENAAAGQVISSVTDQANCR
jgi:hypothetical protein